MSSRKSIATASALLLLAAIGATTPATADEAGAGPVAVCTSSNRVVFRTAGHPGKSATYQRREVKLTGRCSDAAPEALMLSSFVDGPGGAALMAGRTARAIEQISVSSDEALSAFALTNLCVAHTVQREWSQARDACDAAVAAALDQRETYRDWPGTRLQHADQAAAIAYSNRAVMHWMSRNTIAAESDLARAREIAPKAEFVVRNSALTARVAAHARMERVSLPIG